jgi:hypothetical protein
VRLLGEVEARWRAYCRSPGFTRSANPFAIVEDGQDRVGIGRLALL